MLRWSHSTAEELERHPCYSFFRLAQGSRFRTLPCLCHRQFQASWSECNLASPSFPPFRSFQRSSYSQSQFLLDIFVVHGIVHPRDDFDIKPFLESLQSPMLGPLIFDSHAANELVDEIKIKFLKNRGLDVLLILESRNQIELWINPELVKGVRLPALLSLDCVPPLQKGLLGPKDQCRAVDGAHPSKIDHPCSIS